MSIFEELQVAYRASPETYREYARNSLLAAHQLAHDFREYIGAPETYADPEDETRRPYVRLLSFQLPEGVAVTLDRDAESFPKQQLAFFLRLKLHDGMWHVQLLDDGVQDFRIALARESEKQPLFDHMVAMVNRLLSAKPWEGVEKLPIGFELTHPDLALDNET